MYIQVFNIKENLTPQYASSTRNLAYFKVRIRNFRVKLTVRICWTGNCKLLNSASSPMMQYSSASLKKKFL